MGPTPGPTDPRLAAIVEAWPTLGEQARDALAAIAADPAPAIEAARVLAEAVEGGGL